MVALVNIDSSDWLDHFVLSRGTDRKLRWRLGAHYIHWTLDSHSTARRGRPRVHASRNMAVIVLPYNIDREPATPPSDWRGSRARAPTPRTAPPPRLPSTPAAPRRTRAKPLRGVVATPATFQYNSWKNARKIFDHSNHRYLDHNTSKLSTKYTYITNDIDSNTTLSKIQKMQRP